MCRQTAGPYRRVPILASCRLHHDEEGQAIDQIMLGRLELGQLPLSMPEQLVL